MKKNLITILLIFAVPVIAYMALTKSAATTAQPAATATNTANKPQVIKFTSAMCLDCQKMNDIFKEIFPKYEGKIILTEIPVQDGSSFTNSQIEKYSVTLVPTIILLDATGKQVKRIEGAIEKDEMENLLKGLE